MDNHERHPPELQTNGAVSLRFQWFAAARFMGLSKLLAASFQ